MSSAAPGYSSWAWSQQDWRVVVPLRTGQVDYSERCGGASNRTPSGHVRLCLPVAVVSELIETPEGMAILHAQAMSKQRAPVGTRVPWHPRITALWRAVEDRTPEDRRPMYDNPTTPGTRLEWDDLAGWLASMDEIVRRPSAAKTYRDEKAHLALLTPEVLGTAQSVYELDMADEYVRDHLPPKGQRGGHPLTALMDAVDRTRTEFRHPGGSKSSRVTLSQPRSHAADLYASPMGPLTRYVRSLPAERNLPKPYRLPYALERHPYLVVPLYVQAALPTLPPAPSGKLWMIDPTDKEQDSIYLVSKRTRRIEALTPSVSFRWFHSPRPWSFRWSGGADPMNLTARDAAQGLLRVLGYVEAAPPTEVVPPSLEPRRGPSIAFGTITSVKIHFETSDEWHSTTMIVVAVLPREWLQQSDGAKLAWVNERWNEIKGKLPPYTVPPAASYWSSVKYEHRDDDQGDEDDTTNHPQPGLGWIDPGMMLTLDKSGLLVDAKEGPDNAITITLSWWDR